MKKVFPILILLALIGAGYYWWTTQSNAEVVALNAPLGFTWGKEPDNRIVGSGTIEAEIVAITTETGGRIVTIYADEGDQVRTGDLLVELDPLLLQAEQDRLEAALATARANLEEVSAPPRVEDVAVAEAKLRQAESARAGAYTVWQEIQSVADNPRELSMEVESAKGQIDILEKEVEAAQVTLKVLQIERDEAARNQSNDEARTLTQAKEKQVEAAQSNLAAAEAELAGARRRVELLTAMRNNPLNLITQANAAQMAYEQSNAGFLVAEAELTRVKAGPMPEEVAVAQAQVQQAEAALARIEVQLAKLRLTAPRDGIITDRPAHSGELAMPGATLMNLGDLDHVTLTVFIPETQIGQVRVGQIGRVVVDAYPDEIFEGTVVFIAPEAEFTPKNVQTEEERVNLVFAVKISLDNQDHRLKPGMPADAELINDL